MKVCVCVSSNIKKGEDPRLPVDLNQKAHQAFWAEIGSMPNVLNPHRWPDSDIWLQSGKQMSAKHEWVSTSVLSHPLETFSINEYYNILHLWPWAQLWKSGGHRCGVCTDMLAMRFNQYFIWFIDLEKRSVLEYLLMFKSELNCKQYNYNYN